MRYELTVNTKEHIHITISAFSHSNNTKTVFNITTWSYKRQLIKQNLFKEHTHTHTNTHNSKRSIKRMISKSHLNNNETKF